MYMYIYIYIYMCVCIYKYIYNYISSKLVRLVSLIRADLVRSSYLKCSVKKDVFKNFENFTRKALCWSLFVIKLHACNKTSFLRFQQNCFSVKIAKFQEHFFFQKIYERLLQKQEQIQYYKLY